MSDDCPECDAEPTPHVHDHGAEMGGCGQCQGQDFQRHERAVVERDALKAGLSTLRDRVTTHSAFNNSLFTSRQVADMVDAIEERAHRALEKAAK